MSVLCAIYHLFLTKKMGMALFLEKSVAVIHLIHTLITIKYA